VGVQTIIRHHMLVPVTQIVGHDVDRGVAEALVNAGQADWGPEVVVPPMLRVTAEELLIGGCLYRQGATLVIGQHLTEGQAAMLIRGDARAGGGVVSLTPLGCG
jgi:hypothetical protein